MGAMLTSTAASAAVKANTPNGGDPDTTLTFTVTSGLLTLSAPGSAALGTGLPGSTITGSLGAVTVTDDRALLAATWTVSASSTDFTTGTGATLATIPAADAGYDPNEITTTGAITATGTTIDLSATPTPVVVGTAGSGNNTAAWNPTISVDLPPAAVGGDYTGTLTQSVA
jgi:hypothetical protein